MAMAPKPSKPVARKRTDATIMPVRGGKTPQSVKPGLPAKPAPRKRTDVTIMPVRGGGKKPQAVKPIVPVKGPGRRTDMAKPTVMRNTPRGR